MGSKFANEVVPFQNLLPQDLNIQIWPNERRRSYVLDKEFTILSDWIKFSGCLMQL